MLSNADCIAVNRDVNHRISLFAAPLAPALAIDLSFIQKTHPVVPQTAVIEPGASNQ